MSAEAEGRRRRTLGGSRGLGKEEIGRREKEVW